MGRERLLDQLVVRLTQGGSASVSAGGASGTGKTTLAVKLAHDPRILGHFRDGVLWAALGKAPAIEQVLIDWAGALGVDLSGIGRAADRALAIKNAIGLRSLLLVIDDVWEDEPANVLRCGGPNCAHLLTTRDDGIARGFAGPDATVKVRDLEPEPAYELLQSLAPEVCAAEPETARKLVADVGGLPLAIELLGGYLGDPKHSGLADLRTGALSEMSDPARRLQLARERLGGRAGERPTLEQTIALSLEDLAPEVEASFYMLGAFAPKPETFELAAAKAVANAEPACFGVLLRRNLIESPDGERLSIHPVMAEYARTRMPPAAVERHRQASASLLISGEDDRRIINREYVQIRHPWDRLVQVTPEVGDLQGLAGILNNMGNVYYALGQRQKALTYFERALLVIVEVGDRQELAATMNNIGLVSDSLGERQKALEYYERALPIMEELEDWQGLAGTLNNIGGVYSALGQPEKALEYYNRVLPLKEAVGDRQGLSGTLNNIGAAYDALADKLTNMRNVYGARDQRRRALKYYECALVIREAVGDRRGLAVTLHNIGRVYEIIASTAAYGTRGKKWQKALEYYERALRIRAEMGDQAGEAVTRFNMGMVYRRQKRLVEAVEQLRYSVALSESVQDSGFERARAELRKAEMKLAAQTAAPLLLHRLVKLFRGRA